MIGDFVSTDQAPYCALLVVAGDRQMRRDLGERIDPRRRFGHFRISAMRRFTVFTDTPSRSATASSVISSLVDAVIARLPLRSADRSAGSAACRAARRC